MKLSKFLIESESDDPKGTIIREYLNGDATKEDVIDMIPEIVEIKGKAALLRFEDYWDLFGTNDNTRWYINNALSYYGGSDNYMDWDYMYEDWKNGWGFDWFTDEQKQRLLKYMSYVMPELRSHPCDFRAESKCGEKIIKFLDSEYDRYTSDIITAFTEGRNEKIHEEVRDEIISNYSTPVPRKDMYMLPVKDRETFLVSLNQLANFIEKNDDGDSDSLTKLLTDYIYFNNLYPDFEDGFYEYGNNFDMSWTHREIDSLLDKIEEDFEGRDFTPTQEYFKLLKDFNILPDVHYDFPKDAQYETYSIDRFDNDENRVYVTLRTFNPITKIQKLKLPIEDVRNLLTNYTLF